MDIPTTTFVLLAFFVAAFLKGITGLGFSTICLPILSILIDLKMAIPLVIIPSLSSNVLVMMQAGRFREALHRFWPLYLSAIPGLMLGVSVLSSVKSSWSRAVLGAILFIFALWSWRTQARTLSLKAERWWSGPVGLMTGVVNGITGSQVMPVLPFLLALQLHKDLFVQTINLSFTLSSLVMLILLSRFGLLSWSTLSLAAVGILPVSLGIFLGGKLRQRLPDEAFRKVVLVFLLVLGLSLMVRV
ncbi:sulfite exporter TauE/SafE family protein [Candidatus Entotheonella palauensis]|nr:sulfite exporter TauE/SafE family protein [Candidatus Entotheonella palauensis]